MTTPQSNVGGALRGRNNVIARFISLISKQPSPVHVIILLHTLGTLYLAYKLNIWIDEGFTLNTTGRGVSYALRQALHYELQPPAYFVLLAAWRKLNDSIFFARLFSVICVGLSLKVIAGLVHRYVRNINPAWIVIALATNPFVVWAATEMRLYAFALLLSASLMLLFYDGYLTEQPPQSRKYARLLYCLVALVALYTHYYLGALLVAHAVVLVWQRRWRVLFDYMLAMGAVGALFAPNLMLMGEQLGTGTDTLAPSPTIVEAFKKIYWRVLEYSLPAESETSVEWRRWMTRVVLIATLVLLAARFFTKRRNEAERTIIATSDTEQSLSKSRAVTLSLIFLTLAAFFVLVLKLTGEHMFYPRHTTALFIPTLLLIFACFALIRNKAYLYIVVAMMLIFNSIALWHIYPKMAKAGDWQRVATYIAAREERDRQPILVFHGGSATLLREYYAGANPIVGVPREEEFTKFDARDFVLENEDQIFDVMRRAGTPDADKIWLVTDNQCAYLNVNYNCETLERFVSDYYETQSKQDFYGSTVRLMHRKK